MVIDLIKRLLHKLIILFGKIKSIKKLLELDDDDET